MATICTMIRLDSVYNYGKYDSAAIKKEAKHITKNLQESRFASTPTHSNPKVQAIIDELMQS